MSYSTKDYMIKTVEYIRGLYRYPLHMLGRKGRISPEMAADVLVFAAHPDDEILGIGTLLQRHCLANQKVKIVYVTNGSASGLGASWRNSKSQLQEMVDIRFREAVQALSYLQLTEQDVICLGYPDLGTYRYLPNLAEDISQLLQAVRPETIYVHTIEGGHIDHDITSFVVLNACKAKGITNVYEWTEYHAAQPLGTHEVHFNSASAAGAEAIRIRCTEEERALKRKMLASHISQQVEQFDQQGEAIRKASFANLVQRILSYTDGANEGNHHYVSQARLKPVLRKFQ